MKYLSLFFLLFTIHLFSNPANPTISNGDVQILNMDKQLLIHASNGSVINWENFSIANDELTKFIQPSSDSSVLNKVVGSLKSEILGKLEANGNVLLLNPNGILIGKEAVIDTNGFLISTLDLKDDDFIQKKDLLFKGNSQEVIENLGIIRTSNGNIALIGHIIKNDGIIESKEGKITANAGCEILLKPDFSESIYIRPSLKDDSIDNCGQISALQTELKTDGNPYSKAIKIDGKVSTPKIISKNGKILISSNKASCEIAGEIFSQGQINLTSDDLNVRKNSIITSPKGTITLNGKSLNNEGKILSSDGDINVNSSKVFHTGVLDVSGENSGTISIKTDQLINCGKILANSSSDGGTINIHANKGIIETTSAMLSVNGQRGGKIISEVGDNSRLFTSGTYEAKGKNEGGKVHLLGFDICTAAANIDASGFEAGGEILIGGDLHGSNSEITNSKNVYINGATNIAADCINNGNGGKIIIWSDEKAKVYGTVSCKGGINFGDGGFVEISGKKELSCTGKVINSGANGKNGILLLDPANIIIDNTIGIYPQYNLINPDMAGLGQFGTQIVVLSTGNVVVTDPYVNSITGAVYLFNEKTAALISTLTGSQPNDSVGFNGIIPLVGNGNYLIVSSFWSNGPNSSAGAVTWGDGMLGVSGVISASNSLVGGNANDLVGNSPVYIDLSVFALPNGNYVVNSPNWTNGGNSSAGASTFGNGLTGISGLVSTANSIVGTNPSDFVADFGAIILSTSNYVLNSPNWANGVAKTNAGAITWVNGTTGKTINNAFEAVSPSNSLVGGNSDDSMGYTGSQGIFPLPNGNYVVCSPFWDNVGLGATDAGSATLCKSDGTTIGTVSSSTSLVGRITNDRVGLNDSLNFKSVFILPNDNYVLCSGFWQNNGTGPYTESGAATYCSGDYATRTTGIVDGSNSLIGFAFPDYVGRWGIIVLTNGNYVLLSPTWSDRTTGVDQVGAVTWCNGSTGLPITGSFGLLSPTNSLVGETLFDFTGYSDGQGVHALPNGNYAVCSPYWDDYSTLVANVGAVTLCKSDGTTVGYIRPVSAVDKNSLTGSTDSDFIGIKAIVLPSSNFVVYSRFWNNGPAIQAGAVTLCSGDYSSRTIDYVSPSNSVVGSSFSDEVGVGGVKITNGNNYVISSFFWNNPSPLSRSAGAATFNDGTLTGDLSSSNSLVGTTDFDQVGSNGISISPDGNYIVSSSSWNNPSPFIAGVGAATWCDGTTGRVGTISSSNSLIGSTIFDTVASGGINFFADSNFTVNSPNFSGPFSLEGAVTYCKNDGSTVGFVTLQNSVCGQADNNGLLASTIVDSTNQVFICPFISENSGTIRIGLTNPNQLDYTRAEAQNIITTTSFITDTLNLGTNVVLQALNDITINSPIISTSNGKLVLQAAGSMTIDANIDTNAGELNVVVDSLGAPPIVSQTSILTIGPGVSITGAKLGFWSAIKAHNIIDPSVTINGVSPSSIQEFFSTYYPNGIIDPNFPFATFFYEESILSPVTPISNSSIVIAQDLIGRSFAEAYDTFYRNYLQCYDCLRSFCIFCKYKNLVKCIKCSEKQIHNFSKSEKKIKK